MKNIYLGTTYYLGFYLDNQRDPRVGWYSHSHFHNYVGTTFTMEPTILKKLRTFQYTIE